MLFLSINSALTIAQGNRNRGNNFGKPKAIVLDTIKGQGVKYFEDLKANHHVRFNDEMKGVLLWEIQNFEKGDKEDDNE